eukprot:SM000071S21146  [mRNA]  locus=s71:513965:514398:- [translate_table: standard]
MDHSVATSEEPQLRQTSCRQTIPLTKAEEVHPQWGHPTPKSQRLQREHGQHADARRGPWTAEGRLTNARDIPGPTSQRPGSPRRDTARRASLASRSSHCDPRVPCTSTARGTNSPPAGAVSVFGRLASSLRKSTTSALSA